MKTRIERLCIEHGLKMTEQRGVVPRILSESNDHLNLEDLYRRAADLYAIISFANVYQTVLLLEEKRIVEWRDFRVVRARCEQTEHGNHYYLVNVDDGNVIEFQDSDNRV